MPNSNWRLTRTTPHPPSMTLSLSFQTPTEVWMVPRWTAASSATGSIPSPGTRAGGPLRLLLSRSLRLRRSFLSHSRIGDGCSEGMGRRGCLALSFGAVRLHQKHHLTPPCWLHTALLPSGARRSPARTVAGFIHSMVTCANGRRPVTLTSGTYSPFHRRRSDACQLKGNLRV